MQGSPGTGKGHMVERFVFLLDQEMVEPADHDSAKSELPLELSAFRSPIPVTPSPHWAIIGVIFHTSFAFC